MQMKTAVTAYLKSKQLLLFAFALYGILSKFTKYQIKITASIGQ